MDDHNPIPDEPRICIACGSHLTFDERDCLQCKHVPGRRYPYCQCRYCEWTSFLSMGKECTLFYLSFVPFLYRFLINLFFRRKDQ